MTMAVVLVVVGLIALYGSQVTFSPGHPTEGPVPTADVHHGFEHAQSTMDFPIVVPRGVPEAWHPNSFTVSDPSIDGPGTVATVRGGWVTPDDTFVMLVESAGDPDQLLNAEFGSARSSHGTVDAGGTTWQVTTGQRTELAWFRHTGATTFLITGDASEADFVTVAESVAHGG